MGLVVIWRVCGGGYGAGLVGFWSGVVVSWGSGEKAVELETICRVGQRVTHFFGNMGQKRLRPSYSREETFQKECFVEEIWQKFGCVLFDNNGVCLWRKIYL